MKSKDRKFIDRINYHITPEEKTSKFHLTGLAEW